MRTHTSHTHTRLARCAARAPHLQVHSLTWPFLEQCLQNEQQCCPICRATLLLDLITTMSSRQSVTNFAIWSGQDEHPCRWTVGTLLAPQGACVGLANFCFFDNLHARLAVRSAVRYASTTPSSLLCHSWFLELLWAMPLAVSSSGPLSPLLFWGVWKDRHETDKDSASEKALQVNMPLPCPHRVFASTRLHLSFSDIG
jgi:hypothetical protein